MLIFLDIDGVLVTAKSWENPRILEDGFPDFSKMAIGVLQPIITNQTKVMLTTSHKSRFTLSEWKKIFLRRGLKVNNIGKLEDNLLSLNRKEEITNWFLKNKVNDDFIIIDDDKSLNELPENLKEHLILTSPMIGLSNQHRDEIDNLIKKR